MFDEKKCILLYLFLLYIYNFIFKKINYFFFFPHTRVYLEIIHMRTSNTTMHQIYITGACQKYENNEIFFNDNNIELYKIIEFFNYL